MVQGGGFGFRRNTVTRPSLPPGFGEREGTYLYVAVSKREYAINGAMGGSWPKSCPSPETPIIIIIQITV